MSNSRASSPIENSVRSVSSIHMVGCTRFYMGSSGMGETEELSKVYHDVAERSSKLLGEFAQKQAQGMSSAVRDEMGKAKAFMDLYALAMPISSRKIGKAHVLTQVTDQIHKPASSIKKK